MAVEKEDHYLNAKRERNKRYCRELAHAIINKACDYGESLKISKEI